jgi:S1-C subfamily serine protease
MVSLLAPTAEYTQGDKMFHKILASLLIAGSFIASQFVPQDPIEAASKSILRLSGIETVDTIFGREEGPYGCTAFAVAPRKFMTANHCVNGTQMKVDGRPFLLLKADKKTDLAVLIVDIDVPALRLSKTLAHRGDEVTGVGYAFAFDKLSFSINRVLFTNYDGGGVVTYPGMWVYGSYVGGMSGGPVLDQSGKVLGMVQQSNSGIGYGVEAGTIRDFLQ